MLSLLLHSFASVCILTALAHVALAVTTETVLGVVGQRVTLPCRLETVNQTGVEVCWGRGEPSLFTCHNTVLNAAGDQISYRKSYRFSVSSSSSLSILNSQPSDSGFYHCRVQLPGLFNDQTSTVHLIIISPHSVVSDSSPAGSSEHSDSQDTRNLNTPHTPISDNTTQQTGSVVNTTEPMVVLLQSAVQQQVNSLQSIVGHTLRVSFIIFIPALLVTTAHRAWRSEQPSQPEEDEEREEGEHPV